jgi:hypothetical protein
MPSLALCNAICRHSLSSLETSGRAFAIALFFRFFDFAFRNPQPCLHLCALSIRAKADLGVVIDLQLARALM